MGCVGLALLTRCVHVLVRARTTLHRSYSGCCTRGECGLAVRSRVCRGHPAIDPDGSAPCGAGHTCSVPFYRTH